MSDRWERVKHGAKRLSEFIGLTEPNAHWVPIPDKAYDTEHPAIRMKTQPSTRSEHFAFGKSVDYQPSNVVNINVARENKRLKELGGE